MKTTSDQKTSLIDPPRVTKTAAQLTAVIHLTIPKDRIQHEMGPGISELMSTVAAQQAGPAGAWFTHHFRMDPEIWDFEISVPVSKPVQAAGRVRPSTLPAAEVAWSTYTGPYEGLGDAWNEFIEWIEANGHQPAPNLWEIYVRGPESTSNPNEWKTELYRPLQR